MQKNDGHPSPTPYLTSPKDFCYNLRALNPTYAVGIFITPSVKPLPERHGEMSHPGVSEL
jgi:hypothetical protein